MVDIYAPSTLDGFESEEQKLYNLVNAYRQQNGLPAIPASKALTTVANRHVLDLAENVQSVTHSWSDAPYDANNSSTWPNMWTAPQRFNTGYPGNGYENAHGGSNGYIATAESALNGWKNSPLHNAVILNQGIWDDAWQALGVSIYKGYATLWFGKETDPTGVPSVNSGGSSTQPTPPPVSGTNVHRFYDFLTGTHFYTADGAEQQQYAGDSRYRYEGAAFKTAGSESVSRFRNKQADTYFYTLSELERETVKGYAGFEYQTGKEFSASSTPMLGAIPVYRFYNLNTGTHFFTPSASERDAVIAAFPGLMRNEGIGFYANPS
jgi:uncharacterized protein YkwD